MMKFLKTSLLLFVIILTSCTDKFDLGINQLKVNKPGNINDTLYIKQNPDWKGFNQPEDMIIGKDGFLYVCDTKNDKIVMMDLSGAVVGSVNIKNPTSIDQDYRLNLLVCAKFDTTINNVPLTFSAVYKIDMVSANHIIHNAPIKRILPSTSFDFNRPDREYTGVTAFYDNSYYVARTGPSNSNPIDPDNALLIFKIKKENNTRKDTLVGRVPLFEPEGTGFLSLNKISSITAFDKSNYDIVITLLGENSFKTQWLQYLTTSDFEGYKPKLEAFTSELTAVNRFKAPQDVEIDRAGNIYVADSEKDSVFKFNSFGDEMESFGGSEFFTEPYSVAHFDRTLYVLDKSEGTIKRYILSTDID